MIRALAGPLTVLLTVLLTLVGLLSCGVQADAPPPGQAGGMVDVSEAAGLRHAVVSGDPAKAHIRDTVGQGLCWIDADRDGDPDLFVPNGFAGDGKPRPWRLYVNLSEVTPGVFEDRAQEIGLQASAWGVGCAVGDVDGDGWPDLFVTTAEEGGRLFRNLGGRFEELATGLSAPGAFTAGALFADVDGDADLDLFVTTYLDPERPPDGPCLWKGTPVTCGPKGFPQLDDLLFVNDGSGRLRLAGPEAGIAGHPGYGLGVLALDADGDNDVDLFVANDSSPNHLFLNRGDGTFEENGLIAGVALSDSGAGQAGMGVDAGDLDGDGWEDLVVTNFSDDVHNFYRREIPGLFVEQSQESGLARASFFQLGWSVLLEDFDLDGDLDAFFANGHVYPGVEDFDPNTSYRQPLQLLFNDGTGRFHEDAARLGPAFAQPLAARGAAAADYDGDGDLDLAVVRDGEPPLLLRNDLPAPGARWIRVRLRGTSRVSAEGLGARVELEAGGRRQVREMRRSRGYLSGGPAELTFGLGDATEVERLHVTWPSGAGEESCHGLGANRVWVVVEGAGCRSGEGR